MRILLVDKTVEGQSFLADLVNAISPEDQESLDIALNLAGPNDFVDRLASADLLIIGSEFREELPMIARKARMASPDTEIILFVNNEDYASEIFRVAHSCRVKKVMPRSSAPLDLLQELVSVQEIFRANGRTRSGKLVVFLQPKGGVGCSTIAAAVAEASLESSGTSLLWDLDIESKDVTRALAGRCMESRVVSNWIDGTESLSKDSVLQGIANVTDRFGVLPPPEGIACKMDYAGHPDMLELVQKLLTLVKIRYDSIIVDAAGKMSPAVGLLVRAADEVVFVIDDSILGLSAAQYYLESFRPLLVHAGALKIICSGTKLSRNEITECLLLPEKDDALNAEFLSKVPYDTAAHYWAGSGTTLFASGSPETKQAFLNICCELGIGEKKQVVVPEKTPVFKVGGLFQRVANAF